MTQLGGLPLLVLIRRSNERVGNLSIERQMPPQTTQINVHGAWRTPTPNGVVFTQVPCIFCTYQPTTGAQSHIERLDTTFVNLCTACVLQTLARYATAVTTMKQRDTFDFQATVWVVASMH